MAGWHCVRPAEQVGQRCGRPAEHVGQPSILASIHLDRQWITGQQSICGREGSMKTGWPTIHLDRQAGLCRGREGSIVAGREGRIVAGREGSIVAGRDQWLLSS